MVDHKCHNDERIRSLENDRTESKVYIKQINENLQEIKSDVRGLKKPTTQEKDNFKQTVVMELIRLVTMLIAILGALFGAVKFLER